MSRLRAYSVVAHRLFRPLLAVVVATLAIVCARSAWAYAPFCDVRGASDDAPPPIMPVADIRFEADRDVFLWTWCLGLRGQAVTESRSHTPGELMSTATANAPPDTGLPVVTVGNVPKRNAERTCFEMPRTRGPSGFAPSVYRPPR